VENVHNYPIFTPNLWCFLVVGGFVDNLALKTASITYR